MGTLSINKNKRNPQSQPSHGSNHIAKKPKSPSSSSKPSRNNTVSRLHLYPDHKAPIRRQIQAPCTIISGFNSTQKRFSRNMRKKSSLEEKSLLNNYIRAKELAVGTCRHVKFENVEQCDDDTEVIEVDNGNVGDSGNVVEVIDVDEEVEERRAKHKKLNQLSDVMDVGVGSPFHKKLDGSVERRGPSYGSGEVEEIRAKYKKLNQLSDVKDVNVGSPLHKKLDGSVERLGPSLRKLRFEIKLKELRRVSCQKPCPVKKEEEEEDVVHDLFSPLTEEEEEMVANALSYSNRKKVLVNHENSNIMITGEALQCLRPRAWLNDEVINIYLELLKDRECREPKKFLKCHFFNTFFYKKLVGGMTRTGYDYESVKRWTAQKKLGYGLDECDKIFVPIHKEIHWCLAVINKKDKKFQYLDSLGGADKKVLRALAKYIMDEVKDKTGKSIDVTSWEQEYVTDLPNQENGYDCGMFMIKYIDFYSRDVGLCFSQLKVYLEVGSSISQQKADGHGILHDLFSPLTEEEEEMVANALSYSNRKKVLVNHENSNIMITGEALQCLRPRAWLNDEVINIYLELLKDRERREPKKFLKCHFFNTFFYKKLVGGMTRTGYDYESVKRWTAQKKLGYGLDDCDKIFVPIHKEIHWCLAVINKKDKKFQYLDSLGGADKKVLRALAKYITDEVKDKTGQSIDVTSWEQEYVTDLPNQENGYDCGMFMIKYIDFYSRDVGLCFIQDDMPYFRKRIAKEILRLRAN
ncbi:Peptidase C48, SUMO/Sentrin/Ubl1 [Artemisia annua]|uniref:Peptidase C48, SUMO/Sentrin/Ubl1 n=1 Tax=Artemisia annua TaxID=35608 RepID=A0A2U1PCQ6_ARTAN|nr:Peptidase C48, SUMO/Sentrin/Ubl1 [Artemisia annua]